jgi:hypothetical protein
VVSPEFSPDGRFLRTEKATDVLTKSGEAHVYLWSVPPRLSEGGAIPEWLLQLGIVCATKVVNDVGQLVDATDVVARLDAIRHVLATLPADAPFAEWGRWILDQRANRPIAPGFTITRAEATALAAKYSGVSTP